MFSILRSRLICQKVWSLPKTLRTVQINHRTYTLSAIYFQQEKPSSILNDNENKSPFIFSKTSTDPKYTKQNTEDDKHERDARAAWDMKMLKYTGYFLGVWLISTLGYVIFVFGAPQIDQTGNVIEDQYSKLPTWQQYFKRAYSSVKDYWQTIKDPTSDTLLPEPLPAPYQPMYTLVIEMSGVLLNPEWTYNTGWRYKKRPGLDYFIKEVGYPVYEVVIYTKETPWATASVIENMDPEHRIIHRLYRENTRYIDGAHVKDLSCLNRDLKKIIYIDWDEKSYQLQPRNALHRLKKWNGQEDDRELLHLAAFLRMIAASGVEDVRDVLDHYNQESDPLEAFLLRQHALLEAEEQKRKAAEAANNPIKQSKGLFGNWKRF